MQECFSTVRPHFEVTILFRGKFDCATVFSGGRFSTKRQSAYQWLFSFNGILFGLWLAQTITMAKPLPATIVFITGAFIGNNCWTEWVAYFESHGYQCIAPAWPHKDAPPEELRNRHTGTGIELNRLHTLVDYFAAIAGALPGKPILIGHSLGGLVVQLLLQRGLGAAGVAVHSFPPLGVSTVKFSFLKAVWQAMAFFTAAQKTYLMPFRKWKHAVAYGVDCKEQKLLYYKYAVPESKLIIRDTFTCRAKINFNNTHAPLLFTSGSHDRMVTPALNFSNYKKYKAGNSITSYKNFSHHHHLVFGHPAWRREADFIFHWLQQLKDKEHGQHENGL